MNASMWRAAAAATVIGLGVYAAPASAQATRTWVSGVGDDANPCSRTAPCKTFAGSFPKTATGGEINCLDPAGYGSVTITRSLSIVCDTVEAGIVAPGGSNGIVVSGNNVVVTLSGLDIDGLGTGNDGVSFVNGASLVLNNVKIRGFTGFGIRFEPTATATLTVRNALLSNNGAAGTTLSGAILVRPAAGIAGSATINDIQVANNQNNGVRVETLAGSVINATLVHTIVSNSGSGVTFRAPSGTGTINATVNGVTLNNNTYGLIANGAAASVRVGDSTIASNGNGVYPIGGAAITSFGDNRLSGNTTNGAFAAITPKQ